MRNRLQILVAPLLILLVAATCAQAKKPETGFLDRTVTVQGANYKYVVFVPEEWSSKKKWPVILFLHGAGERGEDGLIESEVGIATAIRRHRERFSAIVVMPQCRKDVWWAQSPMDDMAIATLEAATKEFHGDKNRTYLTGLSMGGYGTWHLAAKYPGRFAAIAPICGGILKPEESRKQAAGETGLYAEAAKKIGNKTPTWIFHGGADPVVPPAESQNMNEAMKALGGEVHYTEYPGVGHDSWVKAYDDEETMKWMLSKSLSGNTEKK